LADLSRLSLNTITVREQWSLAQCIEVADECLGGDPIRQRRSAATPLVVIDDPVVPGQRLQVGREVM